MNKKERIFDQIKGLTPVNQKDLQRYENEMNKTVIPEIVQKVEEREMLAAESRHREMTVLVEKRLRHKMA